MARPDWMKDRDVEDARHAVTINIRQHHIDEAISLRGDACVAARCTLDALGAAQVWFYRSKAYVAWDDDGPILRYQNSAGLIKRVIAILDDPKQPNSKIKPGLYDLRAPGPAERLGRYRTPDSAKRGPHLTATRTRVMGRFLAAKGS